jgi:hypothetical protein
MKETSEQEYHRHNLIVLLCRTAREIDLYLKTLDNNTVKALNPMLTKLYEELDNACSCLRNPDY